MGEIKDEPADIVVYLRDRGLVLKEKSLVAFHEETGEIAAMGTEAQAMAEKAEGDMVVMSPLRQGKIADYMVTVKLFEYLMSKAFGRKPLRRPVVAVCVPKGITEVEKKAVEDAVIQAGARELVIADVPVEEFVRDFQAKFPKLYAKVKLTIGIGKDEPEKYVTEAFARILEYAGSAGISSDRARELFENVLKSS